MLRQKNDYIEWLEDRVERAHSLLEVNKIGPFAYTETLEEALEKKLNVTLGLIESRSKVAANNIRRMFLKHEVIKHKMFQYSVHKSGQSWTLTLYRPHPWGNEKIEGFKTKKEATSVGEEKSHMYLTAGALFERLKQDHFKNEEM